MNKGAYQQKLPQNLKTSLTYNHRMYAGPLDDTQVWNTVEDVQEYLSMEGSFAYPGQIVSVANGTVEEGNGSKDYSLYVVRSDKSLQQINGIKRYESMEEAEADLENQPVGSTVVIWNEETSKHELYTVDQGADEEKNLNRVSFSADDLPEMTWDNIQNKPTSSVTEIDAAVTLSEKFTEPEEGNVQYDGNELAYKSDIPTEFSAEKIKGVIKPENLPAGAFDICYNVENAAALATVTDENVQNGDTVRLNDTKLMYLVIDDTKLGDPEHYMEAFVEYSAGTASSVEWSGVKNKPTTVDGYGITDAVKTTDVANVVTANKIVRANGDGKIEGDITGDAGTLGGHNAEYFETLSNHDNRETLDLFGNSDGVDGDGKKRPTYNSQTVALLSDCKAAALALLPLVDELPESATEGEFVLLRLN